MSIADSSLCGEPLARAEAEKRLALAVDWRLPTKTEKSAFSSHRRLAKLADFLIAVADAGDESWILLERVWAGFPDPPAFAFLAYRSNGETICEADLDRPSPLWRLPEGVPSHYSPEKLT